MNNANIIDLLDDYCQRCPQALLSYQSVSFEDGLGPNVQVVTAQNVPSMGITSAFVPNMKQFGYRALVVSGWRGNADLVEAIGTSCAYLASNSIPFAEGQVIKDAFEMEVREGLIQFSDAVLVHPFPWSGIEEIAREASLDEAFYLLPISQQESLVIEEEGFPEFEERLAFSGRDVFDLQKHAP